MFVDFKGNKIPSHFSLSSGGCLFLIFVLNCHSRSILDFKIRIEILVLSLSVRLTSPPFGLPVAGPPTQLVAGFYKSVQESCTSG